MIRCLYGWIYIAIQLLLVKSCLCLHNEITSLEILELLNIPNDKIFTLRFVLTLFFIPNTCTYISHY